MDERGEIATFHASVDSQFAFLASHDFDVAVRTSITDRFGAVCFHGPHGEIVISWDAYDGGLEVTVNGRNLWEMLVESSDWHLPGYQASTIETMQRGLERVARYLSANLITALHT
jgi:hypothetical protein